MKGTLGAIALVVASGVVSADASADVNVRDLPACPMKAPLRARVAELSGLSDVGDGAAIDVDVAIETFPNGYRARLVMRAPAAGERTLEESSCEALTEAVALVVSMSSVPMAGAKDSEPSERTEAASAADTRGAGEAPSRELRAQGHLAGLLDTATLPGAAAGLKAGGGVAQGRLRLELEVHGLLSRRGEVAGAPGVGGEFSLLGVGARGCFDVPKAEALSLAPCLSVMLQRLAVSGVGGGGTIDDASVYGAAAAGLELRMPVAGVFALRAGVEAAVPFARQSFVVGGVGGVHRVSVVSMRGQFGPEVRF